MRPPKIFPVVVISFMVLWVGACSSSKWMKSRSANLAPFAEQTISMVGQLNYTVSREEILYLRGMVDYMGGPEILTRYTGLQDQVIRMLKGMVAYSLQVVAISEQNITTDKKVNALADIIIALQSPVLENNIVAFPITREEFDTIINNIRASETYLQALQNSTPLINKFQQYAGTVLDETKAELTTLSLEINDAIEKKYALTREFYEEWRLIRDEYYKVLVQLSRYAENKEPIYFKQMKQSGLIPVKQALKGKTNLSDSEIIKLHMELSERMRLFNENNKFVLPDIKDYHRTILELEEIVKNHDDGIKLIRLAFIAWSRAYGRMAAGKTDPAEWFDITETGNLLFGAARRAAGL